MPLMSRWGVWQGVTWHENEQRRGVLEGRAGELPEYLQLQGWRERDFSSLLIPYPDLESCKELSEATSAH